jgi:anti-sigma factor RsiW
MSACQEYEEQLTLHAAGALEAPESARVQEHLAGCAACRREWEASREVLGLAALPPPSAAEQAVLEALPQQAARAWRAEQVRKARRWRYAGVGLAAAAAVLLVVLAPAGRRSGSPEPRGALERAEAEEEQAEEEQAEALSPLEQWAAADPLAEALTEAEQEPAAEEELEELEPFFNEDEGEGETP